MNSDLLALASAALLVLMSVAWATSVFGLPGNWIALLLSVLYGWWEGFGVMRPWVILACLCLCGLGELFEFVSGYFGAKRFGAGRWGGLLAVAGAILGALLGAGFGYGLGAIPGTVFGAFLGAVLGELIRARRAGAALKAGLGAALGRAAGLAGKLASGAALIALVAVRLGWTWMEARGIPG